MPKTSEVTESWKDKIYEIQYTERFLECGDALKTAQVFPTLENIRLAFATTKQMAFELIESPEFTKLFTRKIKPEFDRIEVVLWGDPAAPETMNLMREYGITSIYDPKRKRIELINSQVILKALWDIHRLTKQWAYLLGFFVRKPFERKTGIEGIEEGMLQ